MMREGKSMFSNISVAPNGGRIPSSSFQFASGISWTANLFNVTGRASFIFFFGAFTGFLSFPPIAGAIIASAIGGFFYLALATILAQVGQCYHCIIFIPSVRAISITHTIINSITIIAITSRIEGRPMQERSVFKRHYAKYGTKLN